MSTSPQIAVTAATGHVGSRVAQLLVQAGARAVLLVRDLARLDPEVKDSPRYVREQLRGFGLPAAAVEGIVGMTAGTRELVPEQARAFVTTTPTTIDAWAFAELRPLLAR